MATTVERIIEEVKTLTPEEQQQVARLLRLRGDTPESQETTPEQEQTICSSICWQKASSRIFPPLKRYLRRLYERHPLIVVQGEPVSETIIRERR